MYIGIGIDIEGKPCLWPPCEVLQWLNYVDSLLRSAEFEVVEADYDFKSATLVGTIVEC